MRYSIALVFLLFSTQCYPETIYFPQVVDGGGYQTTITISNPGLAAVAGTLRLYTPGGQPWPLSINSVVNSQFPVSLPGSGSTRFTTSGTGSIAVGWASLESAGVLSGVANYEVRAGGTLTETVGVLGATPVKRFIVAADYDGHADVGLAIINTGSSALSINLSLLDESGKLIQTSPDEAYRNIPPHGYVTKYASQAFPGIPSVHKGVLVGGVDGEGAIAVVSLILKDGMQSAIPVTDPSIAISKRLLGQWTFDYDWEGEPWQDVFLLRWIEEDPANPGQFSIWGDDDYGDHVSAVWDPERESYVLTRPVPDWDYNDIYVFSFTGENAISGCYYFEDLMDNSLSDCNPLTGVRTIR